MWDNPNLTGLKQEKKVKALMFVVPCLSPDCSFVAAQWNHPKQLSNWNVLGQSSKILVELTWGVIQLGDCIR